MYDAASLSSIKTKISSMLPRAIRVSRKEPISEMGYMTSQSMNRPTRYQLVHSSEKRQSKLVGILLCNPSSPLAESEILGHLPFFHVRSGDAVDFFCAGYGAFWPADHHADRRVVSRIGGEDWLFSNEAFLQVIEEIEGESKWEYGGETELLLIPAQKESSGEVSFDYNSAIVCNLEAMSKDGAFSSVRAFFDDIFRYAKSNEATGTAWGFSDKKGLEVASDFLKESLIAMLPKQIGSAYKKAAHYAIRKIATDF
ncbi:MAG: hypothetical protein V7746_20500 [Halioglobus sp.]